MYQDVKLTFLVFSEAYPESPDLRAMSDQYSYFWGWGGKMIDIRHIHEELLRVSKNGPSCPSLTSSLYKRNTRHSRRN